MAGPLISAGPMSSGSAVSPAIVPCPSGSNRISPFFPKLSFSFGGAKSAFETWADPTLGGTENFRCWGNGDPIPLVDEQGNTIGAHVGKWDAAAYHGPLTPVLNNTFALNFWLRYYPKTSIVFDNLGRQDTDDYIQSTGTTGGENRCFTYPAFRHALFHTDPTKKQAGFDGMLAWNKTRLERRPFFHLSKNANQGTPTVMIKPVVGSLGKINSGGVVDDLGNSRLWQSDQGTPTGWESWDKGHNNSQNAWFLGMAGHPLGAVNAWNHWRWYTQVFPPTHNKSGGYAFDQPRSAMWSVIMAVQAYLLGFEWADPLMIKNHIGGNANGDGTGQNSNAGWKPSQVMETMALRLAGLGAPNNPPPEGWFVDSLGCNNNLLACLCDCTAAPPPGTGTSGCVSTGTGAACNVGTQTGGGWVGSDGVNYGSQIRAVLVWQGMMCMWGAATLIAFHDYIVSIWPQLPPLTQPTYDALKQKLTDYMQQAIDRFMEPTTWACAFYSGVQSRTFATPEPAGYPKVIAQDMKDDLVYCHACDGKTRYVIKQVQNRTDQWIVVDEVRHHRDEFYFLSSAPMAMLMGAFHPAIDALLANFCPQPGEEGSANNDNYTVAARYVDIAYGLRELGSAPIIIAAPISSGSKLEGSKKQSVVISAGPIKSGSTMLGTIPIVVFSQPMKSGSKIVGSKGQSGVIFIAIMQSGSGLSAEIPTDVIILADPLAAGSGLTSSPPSHVLPILNAAPVVSGSQITYGAVVIAGDVRISAAPIKSGSQLQTTQAIIIALIDADAFASGSSLTATVFVDKSVIVKGATTMLSAGSAVRGGTLNKNYTNSYVATGKQFVLEK